MKIDHLLCLPVLLFQLRETVLSDKGVFERSDERTAFWGWRVKFVERRVEIRLDPRFFVTSFFFFNARSTWKRNEEMMDDDVDDKEGRIINIIEVFFSFVLKYTRSTLSTLNN